MKIHKLTSISLITMLLALTFCFASDVLGQLFYIIPQGSLGCSPLSYKVRDKAGGIQCLSYFLIFLLLSTLPVSAAYAILSCRTMKGSLFPG